MKYKCVHFVLDFAFFLWFSFIYLVLFKCCVYVCEMWLWNIVVFAVFFRLKPISNSPRSTQRFYCIVSGRENGNEQKNSNQPPWPNEKIFIFSFGHGKYADHWSQHRRYCVGAGLAFYLTAIRKIIFLFRIKFPCKSIKIIN